MLIPAFLSFSSLYHPRYSFPTCNQNVSFICHTLFQQVFYSFFHTQSIQSIVFIQPLFPLSSFPHWNLVGIFFSFLLSLSKHQDNSFATTAWYLLFIFCSFSSVSLIFTSRAIRCPRFLYLHCGSTSFVIIFTVTLYTFLTFFYILSKTFVLSLSLCVYVFVSFSLHISLLIYSFLFLLALDYLALPKQLLKPILYISLAHSTFTKLSKRLICFLTFQPDFFLLYLPTPQCIAFLHIFFHLSFIHSYS